MKSRILLFIAGLSLVAAPLWAVNYPSPQGRINDFAGILDPSTKSELEATSHEVDTKTTDEIAVVTIASLNGVSVEEYASGLFKAWGIGKKEKNNGVLVLVAVQDHKMRIEVGYGLEPILPDGLAGDIIRHELRPAFKRGDFAGGLRAGTQRIAAILERGQPLSPEERARLEEAAKPPPQRIDWQDAVIVLLFLGLFVAIGGYMLGAGIGAKVGALVVFGLVFGGVPMLMSLAFAAPHLVLPVAGLLFAALGFRKGRTSPKTFRGSGKESQADGWITGSGGGSSSGSDSSFGDSGSSGGDFGGGSSGGGGASGDW